MRAKRGKKNYTFYYNNTKKYLENIFSNTSINYFIRLRRLTFELIIIDKNNNNSTFIDVGGGDGLLTGLIKFSYPEMECYVVDDFKDNWYRNELVDYLKDIGVNFINTDASKDNEYINQISKKNKISSISCLHSIEHWHGSPSRFLKGAYKELSPGGKLILAFPNNSNLKKRLLAIIGKTSWSKFNYWWDTENYRGHVREPNIQDLKLISSRLGCRNKLIYGRNFMGNISNIWVVRFVSVFFDFFLRMYPPFCSDLYLVMTKDF